jgi:hypothetical protein
MESIGKQRYNDMLNEGLHSQEVNRLSAYRRFTLQWRHMLLIAGFVIAAIHFLPL